MRLFLAKGEDQIKREGKDACLVCFFSNSNRPTKSLVSSADLKKVGGAYVFSASCKDIFEFCVVVFSVKQLYNNNGVAVKMNFP